jgi:hypothetical protein
MTLTLSAEFVLDFGEILTPSRMAYYFDTEYRSKMNWQIKNSPTSIVSFKPIFPPKLNKLLNYNNNNPRNDE